MLRQKDLEGWGKLLNTASSKGPVTDDSAIGEAAAMGALISKTSLIGASSPYILPREIIQGSFNILMDFNVVMMDAHLYLYINYEYVSGSGIKCH
jgi:hypothetical protein